MLFTEILIICLMVLVLANCVHIAFNMGKSQGYQQARNEDAAILLNNTSVLPTDSIEDMANHLAQTLSTGDALEKKTIYIVRPSDARAVQNLLKEREEANQNS